MGNDALAEMRNLERRLREVAELYWSERRSQAEIAERQSISRATVARMLDEARERGIVRIRLGIAHDRAPDLERALRDRWRQAGRQVRFRVSVQFNRSAAEDTHLLGRIAARTLAVNLAGRQRRTLAIASSRTMAPILPFAEAMQPVERVCEVLGVSTRSAAPPVGAELARRLGASYDPIVTPFVHRSAERALAARRAVDLIDGLSRARRAEVVLFGGNSTQRFDGTGGYSPVPPAILVEGAESGAVGHVCGWFLDASGRRVPSSLDELRVGIEPDAFAAIPRRVLLCVGSDKAPIIGAAVASGMCTTVVTDATTARDLLEL